MAFAVTANDIESLLVILKIETVQNRGIVCGADDLFSRLFCQCGKLPHEFRTELGIQRSVDVVDREELGGRLAQKQSEVEQQVEESFIGAALVKEVSVLWQPAILNPQPPFDLVHF